MNIRSYKEQVETVSKSYWWHDETIQVKMILRFELQDSWYEYELTGSLGIHWYIEVCR